MTDAFDPFGLDEAEGEARSSQTKHGETSFEKFAYDYNDVSTSFESGNFAFTAAASLDGSNLTEEPLLFPTDPMNADAEQKASNSNTTIHMALQEQLTCMYETNDSTISSTIEGSIHIQSSTNNPFLLVITDSAKQINHFVVEETYCTKVVSSNTADHTGTSTLRVALPANSPTKIASYTCSPILRPVPFLVKSKVKIVGGGGKCGVGVKIRSNPENSYALGDMAIIMAVPPDIRGETVKLTKQGGVWDGMKRIMAWSPGVLEAGALLEIQALFDFVIASGNEKEEPKFPILVRCDASNHQFSAIEVIASGDNNKIDKKACVPVKMNLTRSVRIIYRKV